MSTNQNGFRSRQDAEFEARLRNRYRQIGIPAVAAAKSATQQQAGHSARQNTQFGWMAEIASRDDFSQQG
ncbi:MAG: hypothetical protein WBO55_08240 [Rhizobiaceae bacterium]